MNNIDIHNRIDVIVAAGSTAADPKEIKDLISEDFDARKYFFSRADETWIAWLFENNFLEVIKQKAEDPTRYSYQTPELDYLVKVAEKAPKEVTDIMLGVDVPNNFNPEVVDRFVWICAALPAEQIARMAPKIKDENWVPLMNVFNRWGFEYKNMFEKLSVEENAEAIIALAGAILSVKPPKEEDSNIAWRTESPFYFEQIEDTFVFNRLAAITGVSREKAFKLVSDTLAAIVGQGSKGADEVFMVDDSYHLFDIDFFNLTLGSGNHFSARDDVRSLAAINKMFAEQLIGGQCGNEKEVRRIYAENIEKLPDSRSMWRFRLFVWSLCPTVFQKELMDAFSRAFSYENNWPIVSGAEYEWALKKSFGDLPEAYRNLYIRNALDYYGKKEVGMRDYGYDILSSIPVSYFTEEDKNEATVMFGKTLNPEHTPQPSIRGSYAHTVAPQAVVSEEDFAKLSVEEVVKGLKNQWSPEVLRDRDTERNYLRPRNAEGMADRLQGDMKKRLAEYILHAPLFLDRNVLDPHYTYSFIRGLCDAYKVSELSSDINWEPLMTFFSNIISSAKQESFAHGPREREGVDGWLMSWDGVHHALADLVKVLLDEGDTTKAIPFQTYREQLLITINYLLEYPNPEIEKHEPRIKKTNAELNPHNEEARYTASDPFTTAINSVRGRTFQSLIVFIYHDSKQIKAKTGKDALSEDVKEIYERLLKRENTEAVMFEFGHYLATFYYRDSKWIEGLLSYIFPREKPDLFLASWEGYLASNLYNELFPILEPLYKYAIGLNSDDYTPRRYFAPIDESLATHIALAYMHFPDFTTDSSLFQEFWNTKNNKRHQAFASFVGRHAISRENAKNWDEENGIDIQKLASLWDWMLEKCSEPSVFAEFGFWINTKDSIFEVKWLAAHLRLTLEKSGGHLDWDLGLMQSLETFAAIAPEDTIEILRSYLTVTEIGVQYRTWVHIDDAMTKIFRILFINPKTKDSTYALINELLPRGNGQFWKLKEALE